MNNTAKPILKQSLIANVVTKQASKLSAKVDRFLCIDVLTSTAIKNFDDKHSKYLSTVLEPDFKQSFKTIHTLIDEGIIEEQKWIAEGYIILDGSDSPIEHCWILNENKSDVIDPTLSKLEISPDKVNYFVGITMSVSEFVAMLECGTYPVKDNVSISSLLSNSYNLYVGRMYNALKEASFYLLSGLQSTEIISGLALEAHKIDSLSLYSRRLHELN